jgi:hypothetical protein
MSYSSPTAVSEHYKRESPFGSFWCPIVITTRHQQTQRTLLDWLRVEYAIEKPSNKLLPVAELDSDT